MWVRTSSIWWDYHVEKKFVMVALQWNWMAFIPISSSGAHKTIPEIFLFSWCFKRITLFIMSVCVCACVTVHWLCIVRVSFVSSLVVWMAAAAAASNKLIFIKTKSKSLIRPTSLLMATLNVLSRHRSGSTHTHIPFCFALKLTIIYHLTKCHFFTIYLHDSLRISFNSFADESFFFRSLPKNFHSKFQFHINST